MDKNTVIGFVLIGLVFIGFTLLNRPSKEQLEEQRIARERYRDSIAMVQREAQQAILADRANDETKITAGLPPAEMSDSARQDYWQRNFGVFASAATGTDEVVILENDNLEVRISSKGGYVSYARVKDYVTYNKEPLVLFEDDEASFNVTFGTANNLVVNTSDLYFTPIPNTSKNMVTMRLHVGDQGIIDFIYTLNPADYMLDFVIQTSGLNGLLALSTNSMDIQWNQTMRIQEKGRKLENQYTGLYYKFLAGNVEHFGEAKDEKKQVPTRLKWVGYKNKFFSSVLIVDDALSSSILSATQHQTDSKYLKEFRTTTSVAFSPAKNEAIGFRYFFGPNKYQMLRSYDKSAEADSQLELDKLVPMGYNWLRPINRYFILPIFEFLGKYMTNYGLIILLLTLIVKIVLFPLTYKSSMSQAKMRVMKPQVDALKLKFPKKEQAMELQQATMALYSSAGASPMSGCLPMMLQMPILFALYWLFPTNIELRQQSFLWAEDLSTYDAIISWEANIPLISSFIGNHISLFCLLMAIVNIISTKMTSSMNAGQQQMAGMNMMMYMMPIMFFFFFNQNSAGLSYYFLISTLITIGQTMLFRFGVNEQKLLAELEANKKKPKKKSGFMQRMADMQKQQQETLRKQQKEREKKLHSGKRRN